MGRSATHYFSLRKNLNIYFSVDPLRCSNFANSYDAYAVTIFERISINSYSRGEALVMSASSASI